MPNLWFQTVHWVYLTAMALWIGGTAFFGFGVAPVLFRDLERDQAGALVQRMLERFDKLKHVLAPLILLASLLRAWFWQPLNLWAGLRWLALAGMFCAHFGIVLFLLPPMRRLRAEIGALAAAPPDLPARVRFNQLHHRASLLTRLGLVAGLLALFLS